jgi:hypothetical protein
MDEPRDWPAIARLYGEFAGMTGSAVVKVNRAIAVAETDGAEADLGLADRLDLDGYQDFGYQYFHPTRANLLRRFGRADEARTSTNRPSSSRTPSRSAASCSGASPKSAAPCSLGSRSHFLVPTRLPTRRALSESWSTHDRKKEDERCSTCY